MNPYQAFWRWWYGDDYSAYLKSWRWRLKRWLVIWADGSSCVICNSRCQLQVHHRTYRNIFCERLSDLTTLCSICHCHADRLRKTNFSGDSKFSLEKFIRV